MRVAKIGRLLLAASWALLTLAPVLAADAPVAPDAYVVSDRPKFSLFKSDDPFDGIDDPTLLPVRAAELTQDASFPTFPRALNTCGEGEDQKSTKEKATAKTSEPGISKDAASCIKRANKADDKNGLGSAIAELEKGLNAEPASSYLRKALAEKRCQEAQRLLKEKKTTQAADQFRLALYVLPDNEQAHTGLNQLLVLQGIDPKSADARRKLAEDLEDKPDFETAIVEYRICVALENKPADRVALGWVLRKYDLPREAFAQLAIAATQAWTPQESRSLAECHRYLGDILWDAAQLKGKLNRRRAENSYDQYRQALLANPQDKAAQQGVINVTQALGKEHGTVAVWIAKGCAELLAGDIEGARQDFDAARQLDSASALVQQATISLVRRLCLADGATATDVKSGVGQMQTCLDANPNDALCWYVLGRLKEKQGDLAAAADAYHQAEDLNANVDTDLKDAINRCANK